MKRPLGITLLAIVCFVHAAGCLYYTAARAVWIWSRELPWPPGETWWETVITHPITFSVIMLALAVFFLRLGWGLWKLQNSARIGMAVLIVLNALLLVSVERLLLLEAYSVVGDMTGWEQLSYYAMLGLHVALVVYLVLPSTRRAFGQAH